MTSVETVWCGVASPYPEGEVILDYKISDVEAFITDRFDSCRDGTTVAVGVKSIYYLSKKYELKDKSVVTDLQSPFTCCMIHNS
jgi:hypothetical protein